jgi:hypothetical protein
MPMTAFAGSSTSSERGAGSDTLGPGCIVTAGTDVSTSRTGGGATATGSATVVTGAETGAVATVGVLDGRVALGSVRAGGGSGRDATGAGAATGVGAGLSMGAVAIDPSGARAAAWDEWVAVRTARKPPRPAAATHPTATPAIRNREVMMPTLRFNLSKARAVASC